MVNKLSNIHIIITFGHRKAELFDLVLPGAFPLAWLFLFVPFVPSLTVASGLTVTAKPA